MNKNLKFKTLSGLKWGMIGQIGKQSIQYVILIILMRLLEPSDFGLLTMIAVFSGFANVLMDFGFGNALIQKKEVLPIDYSSVFWVNIVIGASLTAIFIISAKGISDFYGYPILKDMTLVLSSIFTIGAFGVVQRAMLLRHLNLRLIAIAEIFSYLIAGVIAITLAYNNFGVWALVTQSILIVLCSTLFFWLFNSWRPQIAYSKKSIQSIFNFSVNLFGTQSVNYFGQNVDKLIIGKVLGDSLTGIYGRTYSLIMLPLTNINSVIFKVMFSSFSKIQDNLELIKQSYIKVIRLLFAVIVPLMLVVVLCSEQIILVLFGEKWAEMIPLLKASGVLGIIVSMTAINAIIFLPLGRSDWLFRINLLSKAILFISILITVNHGLMAIFYGLIISWIIQFSINWIFASKLISLRLKEYISTLSSTVLISTLSYISVIGVKYLLTPFNLSLILELLTFSLLFGGIYIGLNFLLKTQQYKDIFDIIKDFLPFRKSVETNHKE